MAQLSQKGFRVPSLSYAHLDDVTRSRQLIECEALRLAIQNGTEAWEAEIVSSFHLLERHVARLLAARRPPDDEYELAHSRLHRALVAACPLSQLKIFSENLYIQGSRYRALMLEALAVSPAVSRDIIAIHRRLKDLTLARDSERAVAALNTHIAIPAKILLDGLSSNAEPKLNKTVRSKPQVRAR